MSRTNDSMTLASLSQINQLSREMLQFQLSPSAVPSKCSKCSVESEISHFPVFYCLLSTATIESHGRICSTPVPRVLSRYDITLLLRNMNMKQDNWLSGRTTSQENKVRYMIFECSFLKLFILKYEYCCKSKGLTLAIG